MDIQQFGWGRKATFGVGSIAYGIKDSGFSTFLMIYFNQVLGLPAVHVGIAFLIAMVFDAVTDPWVGHISDRWKSRLGRRHPFMYLAILPSALTYFYLWNPPNLSGMALFGFLVVAAVIVRLSITLFEVPNSALIGELSQDYDGRTALAGFRLMMGWIGGVVMAIVAYELYLQPTELQPIGQLNEAGYRSFAFLAALVMALAMLISAAGTHGAIRYLPQPCEDSEGHGFSFAQSVKHIFGQKSFRAVFVGSLFSSMVFGVSLTMQVYFATFFFGLSASQLGLLALTMMPAALIAFPLTAWLSRSREKRSVAIFLTWASIATGNLVILLKYLGLLPPNGTEQLLGLLALNSFVATAFLISLQIVLLSMTTDLVEASQRETGHRAEGLYLASFSFTQKVVTGIGMFCSGLLLSIGGQDGELMNEQTMMAVAPPYMVLVAALYLGSIMCLQRFQLTRARHVENLSEV